MRYISIVTSHRASMRINQVREYTDGTVSPQRVEHPSSACTTAPTFGTMELLSFDRMSQVPNLFDIIPESFFSLLSSQNKFVYFRVLMILRECYQGELRFRRADLVASLIHHMESELMSLALESEAGGQAGASTESMSTDSEGTLSGRAHLLVRRLLETGWLTSVPDESSLDELLLVPDYAIAILDVLYSIVHPAEKPYNSYVYSTYSVLRTANEERDYLYPALQSAFDNTQSLQASLRSLLHNIHKFYQNLQTRREIRELLQEHFDEYQMLVAAKTYHPLKTVDSVHRFRPRILAILRDWLQSGEILDLLVQSLLTHRPVMESGEARYEIIRMIQSIIDSLEGMDSFLREIDRRNSAYSRASAERIQYLLNTDRDVKGKLVEILKCAPPLAQEHPSRLLAEMTRLPVFAVAFADPDALYSDPVRRQRGQRQPLAIQAKVPAERFAAEAEELIERANALYSHDRIVSFILSQMPANGILPASQLSLEVIEDYLRIMMAVVKSDEPAVPYTLSWNRADGRIFVRQYGLPAMTFSRKEE